MPTKKSNVVPLRPCACGGAGRVVKLSAPGVEELDIVVCDKCRTKTDAHLKRVRPIFQAMLAAKVPRKMADETMTFLLERLPERRRA